MYQYSAIPVTARMMVKTMALEIRRPPSSSTRIWTVPATGSSLQCRPHLRHGLQRVEVDHIKRDVDRRQGRAIRDRLAEALGIYPVE